MKIFTNQRVLELKDIQEILMAHENDWQHKLRLKDYYVGKHKILHKKGRQNGGPNNMIVSNYCRYITDMSTGFFLGRPVAYTTTDKNLKKLDTLLEIFIYNDNQIHSKRRNDSCL